jgi:uncharacterized protein (TIGR03437 family)
LPATVVMTPLEILRMLATLAYSGLAYGLVGLYQFNIYVPLGLLTAITRST